ncbi:MAG TPA: preprotein translocase subunit SecG [Planctomycetaceae bacterium]|jgi:preprotein translocase subunit SecG|nr:preprotein translocase subunit SecG [Planctomycetaceae bacterium]
MHWLTDISSIVFLFVGLLLIFVILLQRGRGGGLAGAFGGAGGQSAFGTKAGDVFTRITIGIAIVWVLMAVLTGYAMTYDASKTRFANPNAAAEAKDAAREGTVEPVSPAAAGKPSGFDLGSKDDQTTPSKDAAKTGTTPPTTTVPKSPPAPAGKTAPATKTAPTNPPATK